MNATLPLLLLGSASAQITSSWVVPKAFATTNAASTSSFPFTYTGYVRYMQAIDASAMGRPRLIEGLAVRPRGWGLGQQKPFKMTIEVRVSLSAKAVNQLVGTYASNVKGTQVVAYRGPLHFQTPTGNNPAEFSTTLWFKKPFLYLGTDPLLLDFIPLDPCAGGGDSRGCDYDRTDPGVGSVLGKNKTGCGTPTSGGITQPGGFVIKFFGATLMPYGLGCKGSNGKVPVIGSSGGPKRNSKFRVDLSNARASSTAVLAIGLSRDKLLGTFPLPISLTPAGMPSCFVWSDTALLVSAPTDASGRSFLPLPIPNSASLAGVPLFNQWLVVDLGANRGNLVTSAGGASVIR
ncbi:MAG: hypothetical protein ACE5F1_11400 [Planctomycetota bacterium]